MTDPSQPDHLQDPKPEGDDQAKKETVAGSEEGIDAFLFDWKRCDIIQAEAVGLLQTGDEGSVPSE